MSGKVYCDAIELTCHRVVRRTAVVVRVNMAAAAAWVRIRKSELEDMKSWNRQETLTNWRLNAMTEPH